MQLPSSTAERALRNQGFRLIAGADEAGRGAWAGPLVAAAVILPLGFRGLGIRDSKLLSPDARERHYARITAAALAWAVASADPQDIDTHGLQPMNLRCLYRAVRALKPRAEFALVDGFRLPFPLAHRPVIGGDRTVLSIAAASIIAKVTRDRLMRELHGQYPAYGFHQHKGYGTEQHRRKLAEHGPSPIHRMSFQPVLSCQYA